MQVTSKCTLGVEGMVFVPDLLTVSSFDSMYLACMAQSNFRIQGQGHRIQR